MSCARITAGSFAISIVLASGAASPAFAQLDNPFPLEVELGSLEGLAGGDGSEGVIFEAIDRYDRVGASVSNAGDINGDGIDDFIIASDFSYGSAYNTQSDDAAYVIFGRPEGGFKASFALENLTGSNGFRIARLDRSAYSFGGRYDVSRAGDINGDGIDDIVMGGRAAYSMYGEPRVTACVIFGRDTSTDDEFSPQIDPATLDGTDGFRITSLNTMFGGMEPVRVSNAGDFNGDGVDDLIVGDNSDYATKPGERSPLGYVLFGRSSTGGASFPAIVDAGALGPGEMTLINEPLYGGLSQYDVSGAGDLNGDGVDDIIVGGTSNYDTNSTAYVVFGASVSPGARGATAVDVDSLDGNNGFGIGALNASPEYSSVRVSQAGDVNGDGVDDAIVGGGSSSIPSGSPNSVVVIFGRDSTQGDTFPSRIDPTLLDGTDGFGVAAYSSNQPAPGGGVQIAGSGDINGDGLADIAIGEPSASLGKFGYDGVVHVLYGRDGTSDPFPAQIELGLITSDDGVRFLGLHQSGSSGGQAGGAVAFAGDSNSDGRDDLLIGAPRFSAGANMDAGRAYLVYGRGMMNSCPADINGDGTLDFFDVSVLLQSKIDYNDDGGFDFFDLSAFLTDFAMGCP